MSRLVHELYAPAGGDAAYATPDGAIVQVPQDFAFADTVMALDEEIPTAPLSNNPVSQPPLSGPRSRAMTGPPPPPPADDWSNPLYETRNLYTQSLMMGEPGMPQPLQPAPSAVGLVTTCRSAFERAKNGIDSSRHEMKQLWSATYDDREAARLANEEDPFVRLAGKLRRVRALWSFFEWDRADVMRAAWIGVAVFIVVAAVGAFALQR